jgi:sterol O-acyltransferase
MRVQDDPDSSDEDEDVKKNNVLKPIKNNIKVTSDQEVAKQDPSKMTYQFVLRDSKLNQLINEDDSVRGVYSILFVVFFLYFWTCVLQYILDKESWSRDAASVRSVFPGFFNALLVWVGMKLSVTIGVYVIASALKNNPTVLTTVTLFIEAVMTTVTPLSVYFLGIRHFSAFALFLEQLRLQFKSWAFIAEVNHKFCKKSKDDMEMTDPNDMLFMKTAPKMPTFSSYVYFLFAPTLIFREEYPRSKSRKIFSGVITPVFEILIMCMLCFKLSPKSMFATIGKDPLTPSMLVSFIFPSAIHGLVIMLCAMYGLLNNWHIIWSEILGFGDRLFTSDFWIEQELGVCFRKWNLIVSNFNINYILIPLKKRGFSVIAVGFLILLMSALLHEFAIAFVMGFYLPIITVSGVITIFYVVFMYLFSFVVDAIQQRFPCFKYLIIWTGITITWTALLGFNVMEFYSRQNCPLESPPLYDIFIPRMFSCVTLTGIPDGIIKTLLQYVVSVV